MNQSVNNDLKYQELLILAYFKAHYKKYEFNDIAQIMGMTYVEMRDCIEHLLELNYFQHIFLQTKKRCFRTPSRLLNLIHLLLTKIRNNLGFKQYPLRHDGTLLQPRCLILKIHLHKGSKFHIHAGTLPLQEFPFPLLSILLGSKSTLHLGLTLTEPVLIVAFAIPSVSFLVLINRHTHYLSFL